MDLGFVPIQHTWSRGGSKAKQYLSGAISVTMWENPFLGMKPTNKNQVGVRNGDRER